MTLLMTQCKKRLTVIWCIGFVALFVTLLIQSIKGHYGDNTSEAWGWLFPTILPTLLLILGVMVSDAINKPETDTKVDSFIYNLAKYLSIIYLLVVSATILLQPFSSSTPLELMKMSNIWLGPLQGVVAA